jgi:hypothetical protein
MTYIISRAKIRRCGGQIDTSLAWRREEAAGKRAGGRAMALLFLSFEELAIELF